MRLRDIIIQAWSAARTDSDRDKVLSEVRDAENAIVAEALPGERELVKRINRLRAGLVDMARRERPGVPVVSELGSEGDNPEGFSFNDDLTMIQVLRAMRTARWHDTAYELRGEMRYHACRVTDAMKAEVPRVAVHFAVANPVGYRPPVNPDSVECRICKAGVGAMCDSEATE